MDIASNCNRTIAQIKQNIRETETNLKSVTAKEEYFQIAETLKTREARTKRLLHQRRIKKFNSLKCKPETTREERVQPTKESTALKKSYANAVSDANNVKYNNHIISRNTSDTNVANEPHTILGKLEAQNPRNCNKDTAKYHLVAIQKLTRTTEKRNTTTKVVKNERHFK